MQSRNPVIDLALIAVFAALVVVFAVVSFPVPGTPVPLTLQILAVALCGLVLGPWRGFLAVLLYELVGFAGAPVFSGGASTVAVLSGPTAGYLVSFPLYALFLGLVAQPLLRRTTAQVPRVVGLLLAALVGRLLVIWPLGAAGISLNVGVPYAKALTLDLPFWVGDLLKVAAAAVIAVAVHKAFPALVTTRRADEPSA